MNQPFLPLEGSSLFVVHLGEVVDGLADLLGREEVSSQGRASKDAEPDLHLVQPGSMGRREMEMDIGMRYAPEIDLGLVGGEVIEDDVDLFARVVSDHFIHEAEELSAALALEVTYLDHAGGYSYVQGGEESGRAVPFVFVTEADQGLAVGQAEKSLGSLQGLDGRLLIDREDHRFIRRVEVEADHISRFLGELGVGGDAPAPSALHLDAVTTEDSPDLVGRNICQSLGQELAVPGTVALGGRSIELGQDPFLRFDSVEHAASRARGVGQPLDPHLGIAGAPLGDTGLAGVQLFGDLEVAHTGGSGQDDAGSLLVAGFRLAGSQPGFKGGFIPE